MTARSGLDAWDVVEAVDEAYAEGYAAGLDAGFAAGYEQGAAEPQPLGLAGWAAVLLLAPMVGVLASLGLLFLFGSGWLPL